jgi:putative peptidoglycan lipid II flippase
MVKRFFSIINKQYSGIHEAAILLGLFSFLSQFLGLIRDRLLVSAIGPTIELDIYYAAFKIPDLLFNTVASLVAVTAILPFLNSKLENGFFGTNAKKFMDELLSAFILVMTIVSLCAFFTMPFLVKIIAPGFDSIAQSELIIVSRIMLLSPVFLGFQNLFGSIVQTYKKFFVFALAPVFYNLGIIFGILFLYEKFGLHGLAWGVVLGSFLHLLIHIPAIYKIGYRPNFTWKVDWRTILQVSRTALPRTLTLSMNTITVLALIAIASSLTPGSISLYSFALNLQSFPVLMIGVSYAIAIFPTLVKNWDSVSKTEFYGTMYGSIKQLIFWLLPTSALFVVLRAHIVRVVYGANTLSWDDTKVTAALVALLSLAVIFQSINLVFIRSYYASGRTFRPFIVNGTGMLATIMIAFVSVYYYSPYNIFWEVVHNIFKTNGIQNTEVMSLAFAFTLGHMLTFLLYVYSIKNTFPDFSFRCLWRTIWTSIIGAISVGSATYLALGFFVPLVDTSSFFGILWQGLSSGIVGIASGVIVLYLLSSEELVVLWNALHTKFWKTPIDAPTSGGME